MDRDVSGAGTAGPLIHSPWLVFYNSAGRLGGDAPVPSGGAALCETAQSFSISSASGEGRAAEAFRPPPLSTDPSGNRAALSLQQQVSETIFHAWFPSPLSPSRNGIPENLILIIIPRTMLTTLSENGREQYSKLRPHALDPIRF